MSITPQTQTRGIAAEPATARLSRLLTMVPWLMNRQGIDIDEAAQTLGVSTQQIEADLQLLFVCGTPGHLPDDLIEAEWERGHVFVRNADEISKPLRLTRDEALSLSVGLRALLDVPGLTERDAVDRALAKLIEATGETTPRREQITVELESDGDAALRTCREALAAGKQLHLRYLVPSRDEMTERDVDPTRLFTSDGHWYLEAWCRLAQDTRMFRLDRVDAIRILDSDANPPTTTGGAVEFFTALDAASQSVHVRLSPSAYWVTEFYPCLDVARSDAHIDATFIVGDGRWLTRLMMQLGEDAQILEPHAMRESVHQAATDALANYGL